MSTFQTWIEESQANKRAFAEEHLILEVAQKVWEAMEDAKVTRAELAGSLSRTRSYITQVLSGSTNLTLRTLAAIGDALNYDVKFELKAKPKIVAGEQMTLTGEPTRSGWQHVEILPAGERMVKFCATETAQNQPEWNEFGRVLAKVAV
jgi:transcriptional regulator with XRE-family HTH domain